MLDVIEAIGRPRGSVMYYRYRRKWVDPELWRKLPLETDQDRSALLGFNVLTIFVYQEIVKGHDAEWRYLYPVRFGMIKECYKTGDGPYDVAYFYFEVQDYCSLDTAGTEIEDLAAFNQAVMNSMYGSDSANRCFAALRQPLPVRASTASDASAFQNSAGRFRLEHFKSADGSTQYFPVFTLVGGINGASSVKYDQCLRKSYYELTEGKSYVIESRVFLKKPPATSSTIELSTDERQFVNLSKMVETIASPYDQLSWMVVPARVAKDVHALIEIDTNIKPPEVDGEALNLNLPIHIVLKFNRWWRIADTVQDFSLATATILIAAVGLLQNIDSQSPWISIILVTAAIVFCLGVILKAIWLWSGKWS